MDSLAIYLWALWHPLLPLAVMYDHNLSVMSSMVEVVTMELGMLDDGVE